MHSVQAKNAAPTLTMHPLSQSAKPTPPEPSTLQALKCCQGQSNANPVWIFLLPSGSNKAHPGARVQGCLPVLPDSQTALFLPLCSLAKGTSQRQQSCQGTPWHRDNHETSRMPTSCWHCCSSQGWDKFNSNVQHTGARCPPQCDLPTLAKASLSSSSSSLEICMVLAIS